MDKMIVLQEVERPGREAGHLPPSKVKKNEAITPFPLDAFMAYTGLYFTGPSELIVIQHTKNSLL
jgi:hypothetical protein